MVHSLAACPNNWLFTPLLTKYPVISRLRGVHRPVHRPCLYCQAWTTSYQLTPFTALLDLRAPWGWQQREKNESGGVECRRIDKIKSSEYMSEYPTIYT
jgi:hypothetical protein